MHTSIYRTHKISELNATLKDQNIKVSGWIHRQRDHGGILFIDLRDHYGIVQVVVSDKFKEQFNEVKVESVILVNGIVRERPEKLKNNKLATGDIEVELSSVEVLCHADILPFQIADEDNAPEFNRLKHRFLDLRREKVHQNITTRSYLLKKVRDIMYDIGFLEFQTPILTSSSPEGARDFLVPSRLHPGKFFALPQAPQQFKQLLMVSGFDRYFQIAPCFRDENPRADRSPGEFYQIDLEMSFVEEKDVLKAGEALVERLFNAFTKGAQINAPFIQIPYDTAVETYGTDKPDLRIPFTISNHTGNFKDTQFGPFKTEISLGGGVWGIEVPVLSIPSRKYFDETLAQVEKEYGFKIGYLVFEKGNSKPKGSLQKIVTENEADILYSQIKNKEENSIIFIASGGVSQTLSMLGKFRIKLGETFCKLEPHDFRFCWIVDFPMYERDETTGVIVFSHNPFSMPKGGLETLASENPLKIKANQYDLVCNGYELASGAIRNHSPEIMYEAFKIAGYSKEDVDQQFGGMIRAFKFGAPPHGGMALGFDRIVMLLAEEQTIRDVIAFPLAQTGEDLLMGAPSEVSEKQLIEAHIRVNMLGKS